MLLLQYQDTCLMAESIESHIRTITGRAEATARKPSTGIVSSSVSIVSRSIAVTDGGSTGLGLAICRHIIRNHGGMVWAESPNRGPLNGTTISFTILRAERERQESPKHTGSVVNEHELDEKERG